MKPNLLPAGTAAERLQRAVFQGMSMSRYHGSDGLSQPETDVISRAVAGALEPTLTWRQQEIVKLICQGLSNKEVGRRLSLSEGTVKIHLHNIYVRIGLRNRTALTAFALREMGFGSANLVLACVVANEIMAIAATLIVRVFALV